MALTEIKTSGIADDAVTTDKLANAINTERTGKIANVVEDTSPQLGGTLDCNNQDVQFKSGGATKIQYATGNNSLEFVDSAEARFGSGDDLKIYHNGSNSYIDSATGSFYIRDGTTEKVRVNGYGTAITGGLLFGTDTAAANALDDYEEGQWTPQTHDGSISYQEAYYTKIGRQVTITARIYNISDNSTNDAVRIKNLPFAANVTGVAAGSVFYSYCGQQHATVLYIDSSHSGSLNLYGGYSGAHDNVRHNELNVSSGTTDMYLIATYFAAT